MGKVRVLRNGRLRITSRPYELGTGQTMRLFDAAICVTHARGFFMMTRDQRLIARSVFASRVLKANGQSYQQLFWSVMRGHYGQDFIQIRPQGRTGDGGNDGYLPADGHYYQVYAPIDPEDKIEYAANKLAGDFIKLKAMWQPAMPVSKYSFVFNDKYEGTFTKIALALADIERVNIPVECRSFTASHLEDLFLSLPHERAQDVLDTILPVPAMAGQLDYAVMGEVIHHIMNSPVSTAPTRFGELPVLETKIQLNNLSDCWADILRHGARQSGHVERFFSKSSTFRRQDLRDHIVERYRVVRDDIRKSPTLPRALGREDLVFAAFRESLMPPRATLAVSTAVDILIAYYFETCDVFDPHAERAVPNASP
jgi:hypothetical protein